MPLTASTNLMSFRLAAGEAFVVLMEVDEGLRAEERAFVMSVYGAERAIEHVIDGVQVGDHFEFIRPGTWSESLFGKAGLKIEIAERLKDGRAVIASPSLTVDASALTVVDYPNSVIARSAVQITASFSPKGVAVATADQIIYDPTATPPLPSTPTLPNGVAFRFSAQDLVGADNSSVTAWPDKIAGFTMDQATAANRPKLRTNVLNGKKGVSFNGSQWVGAARAGTDLRTLIDSGNYSVMVVATGIAAQDYGSPFSASSDSGGLFLIADGSRVGQLGGANSAPYSETGYTTFGVTYGAHAQSGGNVHRLHIRGGTVGQLGFAAPITADDFRIGLATGLPGGYGFKGTLFELVFFDHRLTPDEVKQFEAWSAYEHGQIAPSATVSAYRLYVGDSITAGANTGTADGIEFSYPYLSAQALGLSYGQWDNLGIGGIGWTGLTATAPIEVDTVKARVNKPVHMAVWELYNSRGTVNLAPTVVAPYLAARKAAGIDETVFGTTVDYTGAGAEKTAYTNYWDNPANRANIDAYVPLHNNAKIGANGTNTSQYFAGDHVHLNGKAGYPGVQSGYPVLAEDMTAGLQAVA